jgi:uncharacterized membrane protein
MESSNIKRKYRFIRLGWSMLLMIMLQFVAAFVLFHGAKAVTEGTVVVGWTLSAQAIFVGTVLAVVGGFILGHAMGREDRA